MRMRLLAGPRFRASELQGDCVGYSVPETIEGGTGQVKPKRARCLAVPASGRPQWRPVKRACPIRAAMSRIADRCRGGAPSTPASPDRPTRRRQPPMSGPRRWVVDQTRWVPPLPATDYPLRVILISSKPSISLPLHPTTAPLGALLTVSAEGGSHGGQSRPRDNPVDQISLDRRRTRLIPVDVRSVAQRLADALTPSACFNPYRIEYLGKNSAGRRPRLYVALALSVCA